MLSLIATRRRERVLSWSALTIRSARRLTESDPIEVAQPRRYAGPQSREGQWRAVCFPWPPGAGWPFPAGYRSQSWSAPFGARCPPADQSPLRGTFCRARANSKRVFRVFLKLLTLRAERFRLLRKCCTGAGVMLPISHWKARAKRQKDDGGGKMATPTGLEPVSPA